MAPKSPAANPNISPDPNSNGSIIRKAFLAEAVANLFTLPLLTHPRWTLSHLLAHPSDINPSSILFARLFSSLVVFGLTSALLAGYTNTRNGIESRRPTYMLLGLGEVAFIPILVGEMMKEGKEAAISKLVAGVSVGFLLPPLIWRIYVLGFRPELFGRYTEKRGGGAAGDYGSINSRND